MMTKGSKTYTVKQVAEASGVSVRTLHFYDEIGLLKPEKGENNYRYYGEEHLLLLQQILFYRKLGFPLEQIQGIVSNPKFDKLKALKTHREILASDAERVKDLIKTIDKTIKSLEGKVTMKGKEFFQGFDQEKQKGYEKELVDRFGHGVQKHIDESKKKMKGWKDADFERVQDLANKVHAGLVEQVKKGAAPSSKEVQDLIALHYKWVCNFWTPKRLSYIGLGKLYVEHPDFRKFYDPFHPQLAEFLAEAMRVYAENELE